MKGFFKVQLILAISKTKERQKFSIHHHETGPMTFLDKLFLWQQVKYI